MSQREESQREEKKKPSDDPKFNAEVDKIKTFCEALTEEEKACLFKDDKDFDLERYHNFYTHFGIDVVIKEVQEDLESLQEDLEGFHLLQDLQGGGLTIPKLLTRFMKLPELFRTYLKMTVITESVRETYGGTFDFDDESENISDEVFVRHLTAIELSSKDKLKYLKQLSFTLKIFDQKLSEFESNL